MKRTTLILMTVLILAALGDGNVKPGLAQMADDCPYQISGASGRRVCEDTAIEFWEWTALATGPVTFDTRGSDVSLKLTVHTFDPVFATIALLKQDEVHFTAQQGVEYTIFAQSSEEQAGTIVLNWRSASSCGNGGTSLVGSSDETGLREAVFDDPDPGEPAYVLAGPKASIWYWMTDDAVTQSLYVSTDGSVSVRTFHDADGLPHKVIDECTGNWILVQRYDAENVDFWFYDADGNYQSGLAVFESEGDHYYAEIDGVPVHAGKRITGILRPTGASWIGSYTLEVDMSEIQNAQPVPDEIAALINGLSTDEEGRTGMLTGQRSRLAILLGPLGIWLSPAAAAAQEGEGGYLADVLFKAGVGLFVGGIVVASSPAVIIAGGAAVVASFFAPDIAEGIRSRCPASPDMARDFCHLAADNLADPDERGPAGAVRDAVEWAGNKTKRVRDRITSGMRELSDVAQAANPSDPPKDRDAPGPSYSHDTPETVSGEMRREDREPVDVSGTVTPDGDFDVTDDDGNVQLQLLVGRGVPIEGSFEWDGAEGEVEVDSTSDLEDWEVDDDATTTDDEQTELDALLVELEKAERGASEAERGASQAEREAEEARRLAEQVASGAEDAARLAEQAARESDGTSSVDDDTDDSGNLPSTSTPKQTTQYSATFVCWNYSGPFTNCIERQYTTKRDARWECGLYSSDRQGADSCPDNYEGRPAAVICTETTDQGRTTETFYKYYKSASCD